jgi:hypothetical protein
MFKKKKIKSDCITSKLNSFKNDCEKESKKKILIIPWRVKPSTTYNYEEKRRKYCKLVHDLYNGAFDNNDIETLRDRQLRLLHFTEISNNILIGVGGGFFVGHILYLLDELSKEMNINPIPRIIILIIGLLILIKLVIWIFNNLFDSMLAGYKFDNKFGTVSWEIKFLEDRLCKKTQVAIEEMILEDLVKKGTSETIADNAKQTGDKPIEQDDNSGVSL